MDDIQVKKCIIQKCKNDAISFTGHLHLGTKIIDAGFCREHTYLAFNSGSILNPIKGCKMQSGCFGQWKQKYGKESYNV